MRENARPESVIRKAGGADGLSRVRRSVLSLSESRLSSFSRRAISFSAFWFSERISSSKALNLS